MNSIEIRRFAEKFADKLNDEVNVKHYIEDAVVIVEAVTPPQLAKILNQSKDIIEALNHRESSDINDHAIVERMVLTPNVGPVLVIYEFS